MPKRTGPVRGQGNKEKGDKEGRQREATLKIGHPSRTRQLACFGGSSNVLVQNLLAAHGRKRVVLPIWAAESCTRVKSPPGAGAERRRPCPPQAKKNQAGDPF